MYSGASISEVWRTPLLTQQGLRGYSTLLEHCISARKRFEIVFVVPIIPRLDSEHFLEHFYRVVHCCFGLNFPLAFFPLWRCIWFRVRMRAFLLLLCLLVCVFFFLNSLKVEKMVKQRVCFDLRGISRARQESSRLGKKLSSCQMHFECLSYFRAYSY